MKINSLTMRDFCVFQGTHTIELKPRNVDGRLRPIILLGGLNGAGKTTTLSAIRLVLYGARSLGRNASKREYQEHLIECVHQPPSFKDRPKSASIELEFEHGNAGIASTYRVKRHWQIRGEKTEETLQVWKDASLLEELSQEHCQAFLNELIPVGVSDLFFFDGEKIAELAEEEGSAALQSAINRLMGVDLILRLRSDLATYLKEQGLKRLSKDHAKQIADLEKSYQEKHQEYLSLKIQMDDLRDRLRLVNAEISTTERALEERGGAWAASRKSETSKVETLLRERNEVEEKIRQTLSGVAPLFLAKRSLTKLIDTLENEQDAKRQNIIQQALVEKLELLKDHLSSALAATDQKEISKAVDHTFIDLCQEPSAPVVHDLSESDFAKVKHTIESVVPEQEALMRGLSSRLKEIENQIELASRNVDRTPDTALLKGELNRLAAQTKDKAELEQSIKTKLDEVKRALREALNLLRQLRRLDEELSNTKEHSLAVGYAERSQELLKEFAKKTTASKVKRLEAEFVRSFRKLARKDDISLSASIDPKTFAVTLNDAHGNVIKKRQLSAGEKQIYAIAMLEALGRTTGHNLPIIIDTPLGRLDSKHRDNLVHNYFPVASHQIIILSTDTEIDENFFVGLQHEISHGYEITYDPTLRSSQLNEGYFWSQPLKEVV